MAGAADHQESGRAQRRAAGAQRVGIEGSVEVGLGERRRGRATGEDEGDAIGSASARAFDEGAQGRAEAGLIEAWPLDVAPERHEGGLALAKPLGVGQRVLKAQQGLDVVDEGGPPAIADRGGQGRLGPRPGLPPLQRLEERRLLADDVAVVAVGDAHGQALGRPLRERLADGLRFLSERSLQEDDGLACAYPPSGQGQARQHFAGSGAQQVAVLDGAGLAFGAVRHQERLAPLGPHRAPLAGGGVPAPAAAAKPRGDEPRQELVLVRREKG